MDRGSEQMVELYLNDRWDQSDGNVIGHGSPGCFTCGPGETCSHSVWNTTKKLEQMMGQKFGMDL